jgi:hypothetical protein
MPIKKAVGLIGAILLIVGTFTPIAKIPYTGDLIYFLNGQGDRMIVLGLGIISLISVLRKKYNFLIFTGPVSLVIIAFTFFNLRNKISEMHTQLNHLQQNQFKDSAETMLNAVQIEWGFAVLVLGAVLLVIAAFLKNKIALQATNNLK